VRRIATVALGVVSALALISSSAQAGHVFLDHPAPSFSTNTPVPAFQAGGTGASWELLATFPTGNPHTDLDFFTQGGDTYVSVGTLAAGPNGGGQTILRLTERGEVRPSFVSSFPSASCVSNPGSATGLQHDVEAAPKGDVLLNASNPFAVRKDAQIIVDATDADGRCHDQGTLGLQSAPQGGLEIVDITVPTRPIEIGLTSHIGEAHTVNVDPKRPHIAYAVTSDAIGVDPLGKRQNEVPGGSTRNLDGFEVVDMSSCMNFPASATIQQRRDRCRPQVYRYRYQSAKPALGHTLRDTIYACHELEVYWDDKLTCGSGAAAIMFDMRAAFDNRGTPYNFADDKPRGTPLPCRLRPSSSAPPYTTSALVTDCVSGIRNGEQVNLDVPGWLAIGAPSLQGGRWLGSFHHQGRGAGGAATPAFDSTQDIDFDHELELSESRRLLLATDERGGGIAPPGASCSPAVDNKAGNGGIHAYRVSKLQTFMPFTPEQAFEPYARTPSGEKAIYRVPIRTQPQASLCTAHVFQQIPGQNRIFMGWYSQGTQVVDFIEHPNGTVEFNEAGWFLPANANTWVSHVFKAQKNANGTWTYWGATGDFNLGLAGRSAIDIWKATLPAPPKPLK
jgi:hypothetical protein